MYEVMEKLINLMEMRPWTLGVSNVHVCECISKMDLITAEIKVPTDTTSRYAVLNVDIYKGTEKKLIIFIILYKNSDFREQIVGTGKIVISGYPPWIIGKFQID